MHQDVEAQLLLQADHGGDLQAQQLLVLRRRELAAVVPGAEAADVAGLRERADRRGRQDREVESGVLRGHPRLVVAAVEVHGRQRGRACAHIAVADAGRAAPILEGDGCRGKILLDGGGPLLQTARENRDLIDLLVGEGEPGHQPGAQLGLVGDVVRHVLQRGRRARRDGGAEPAEALELRPGRGEIAAPDVAAVDDTADQGLAGEAGGRGRNGAAGEVDGERLDGGGGEHGPGLRGELGVRGGDQDRGALGYCAEVGVRALRRGREVGCRDRQALAHEGGLVELHPLRAGGAQRAEQLGVHRQQVVQAAERAEPGGRGIRRLREGEQRDGADDDRTGRVAVRTRLGDLTGEAVARQRERRLGPDLGDEVVVVRVEPLGHLERAGVARAARGGEQRAEADGAVRRTQVREPLRQDARGHRGVEHLVVVRERLGNRRVVPAEAEFDEACARRAAQVLRPSPPARLRRWCRPRRPRRRA